ncbi:MAG TPA: CBS domain-containing protein [Gemmatimonadaceae bacterium]|nr:CBS domain-containing protein [Gemmatimonadaceae bacterium]
MIAEDRLARAFLVSHPARGAMTLERMAPAQAAAVLGAVSAESAATVMREMTPPFAAGCLVHLDSEDVAAILTVMPIDDAAAIVRAVEPERHDGVLAVLPAPAREALERVLRYPPGTAGSVMDPTIFQLADDVLVADARERIRRAARDLLYYLYVVDREHRLVGVLDIPELMLARPRDPVSVFMHRDVNRLSAWMPVALVREHSGWQRYHAMPVVDEEDRLLGAIRYQTLRRLEREAADSGPDAAMLTARALGELFQLGTTGLVAGVAATASSALGLSAENVGSGRDDDEVADA